MLTEKVGRATLYLADCMDLMKDYPDKAFDIAIVDPPYGDGGGIGRTRSGADSADGSTSTASGSQPRIRRTLCALYHIGILHLPRNTSMNFSGYQNTRLFGVGITLRFRHQGIF